MRYQKMKLPAFFCHFLQFLTVFCCFVPHFAGHFPKEDHLKIEITFSSIINLTDFIEFLGEECQIEQYNLLKYFRNKPLQESYFKELFCVSSYFWHFCALLGTVQHFFGIFQNYSHYSHYSRLISEITRITAVNQKRGECSTLSLFHAPFFNFNIILQTLRKKKVCLISLFFRLHY